MFYEQIVPPMFDQRAEHLGLHIENKHRVPCLPFNTMAERSELPSIQASDWEPSLKIEETSEHKSSWKTGRYRSFDIQQLVYSVWRRLGVAENLQQ